MRTLKWPHKRLLTTNFTYFRGNAGSFPANPQKTQRSQNNGHDTLIKI